MRLLGVAQVAKKARGMSGSLAQSFSAMDLDQGERPPLDRAITALLESIVTAVCVLRILMRRAHGIGAKLVLRNCWADGQFRFGKRHPH
jgi:hypothetical protein